MVDSPNRVRSLQIANFVREWVGPHPPVRSDPLRTSLSTLRTTILVGILLSFFVVLSCPSAAAPADPTWQVGTSVTHSSGDYGTGSTTSITYVPFSIRRLFDSGDITLVIPYLSITGNCGVTLLSGTPNNTGGTCPTTTTTTGQGKKQVTRTTQTSTTQSGLGDILLRGRYYVVDGTATVPTVP